MLKFQRNFLSFSELIYEILGLNVQSQKEIQVCLSLNRIKENMNEARYKVCYFKFLEKDVYAKIQVKHSMTGSVGKKGKYTK